MKKLFLLSSILLLSACVQYEDGEPVEKEEEETSTASEPAGEEESTTEEEPELTLEEQVTEIVNETIGEEYVTDLMAMSDENESTMSVTFESEDITYGPASKDRIDMKVAETLIALKDVEASPFYDITFISTYEELDTADNVVYRAQFNQDNLDNDVTDDPYEFMMGLEDMSTEYYTDEILTK